MFQEAIVNGSRYCGPVVLSAVTGVGTKEIAALIRSKNPYIKAVKGIWDADILAVLEHFSIKYKKTPKFYKPCNLRTWLRDYRAKNVTYIVCVTGHYMAIRNDEIVCTQFHGKKHNVFDSKYLGSRVKRYWVIESEPKAAPIPHAKPKSLKRQVLALCKKHDVEVEHDEHDRDDGLSIWMYIRDEVIREKFGGIDPWEDNHYFSDYEEALEALEEVFGKSRPRGSLLR